MNATAIAAPPLTTRFAEGERLRANVLEAPVLGGILLAVDGTPSSADAVKFGIALARSKNLALQVLTVLEPLPLGIEEEAAVPAIDLLQMRQNALHFRVSDQLRDVVGDESLGVNMQYGRVAAAVARAARDWESSLVVVGVGRHDPAHRIFGSETALRIATAAAVPTLAVGHRCVTPPKTTVVAVDFSEASVRAALAALRVTADGGEVCLVHVNPFPRSRSAEVEGWDRIYAAGVKSIFEGLSAALRHANDQVTVRAVRAEGRPGRRILEIAGQLGAELVAAGRYGHGIAEGARIGGIPAMLLRGAGCSVLVAP